jgi:hypothetical protein
MADVDDGFRSMAVTILNAVPLPLSDDDHQRLYDTTVTALKMTWNARGAADLATLEATVPTTISFADGGLVKQLDRALRKLDR